MDPSSVPIPWSALNTVAGWLGKRPRIGLEPLGGEPDHLNRLRFALHIHNDTPNPVHVTRHRFRGKPSSSQLLATGDLDEVARLMTSGSVNLYLSPGEQRRLTLWAEEGKKLALWLTWRPTTGWFHPLAKIPLCVVMSADRLSHLHRASKQGSGFVY